MSQNQLPLPPTPSPIDQNMSRAISSLQQQMGSTESMLHVVVIPDAGPPVVESFQYFDRMIDYIKSKDGDMVTLIPFMGVMMPISDGSHKHILTPYGLEPLFEQPAMDQLHFSGYMATPVTEVHVPTGDEVGEALNAPEESDNESEEEEEEPS